MRDRRRRHCQPRGDGFPHIVERADLVAALFVERENLIIGHRRREDPAWHERSAILRGRGFHGGGLRRRGCNSGTHGLVHIVLHDAPMRPGSPKPGQIDARLRGEPPGERRRKNAALAVCFRGRGRLFSLRRLLGRRFGGRRRLSGFRRRSPGRLRLRLRRLLWRGLCGFRAVSLQRGRILAFREKHRDRRVYGHALRPFRDHDFPDSALVDGLDFHCRLVGLDLGDGISRGHLVAFLLQPLRELALFHGRR